MCYRQATHSRSARLILERQLASGLDLELATAYFLNLEQLSLAASPGTLTSFLNSTLQRSLRAGVEAADFSAFRSLLDPLKSTLRSKVPLSVSYMVTVSMLAWYCGGP